MRMFLHLNKKDYGFFLTVAVAVVTLRRRRSCLPPCLPLFVKKMLSSSSLLFRWKCICRLQCSKCVAFEKAMLKYTLVNSPKKNKQRTQNKLVLVTVKGWSKNKNLVQYVTAPCFLYGKTWRCDRIKSFYIRDNCPLVTVNGSVHWNEFIFFRMANIKKWRRRPPRWLNSLETVLVNRYEYFICSLVSLSHCHIQFALSTNWCFSY